MRFLDKLGMTGMGVYIRTLSKDLSHTSHARLAIVWVAHSQAPILSPPGHAISGSSC